MCVVKSPLKIYKERVKLYLGELRYRRKGSQGEAHTKNQISGSFLFHIIVYLQE